MNLASRSLEQGQLNVTLYGKPLAEWSDEEATKALGTVGKCAPNLVPQFQQQLSDIMAAVRRLQAERQATQLRAQAEINNNASDEAKGYHHIGVDTFLLDGKELAAREQKIAINGVYIRQGNWENLYVNRQSASMDRNGYNQPSVPLLTENATRDFRRQQLNCQASQLGATAGCLVTVLGHATICKLTNGFGAERDAPCIDVEDGRFSVGP